MSTRTEQTLRTPRLDLEPIRPVHAEALFEVLCDETIYEFTSGGPPESAEALRGRYALLTTRQSPNGRERWLNWAIYVRAARAYAGVLQATIRADATALLAYELGTAFRGHGYATEGCTAVIRELENGYGVRQVDAHVDTYNGASIRLLERLGFRRRRTIERAERIKDRWSDEFVYTYTSGSTPPN